MRAFVVGDRVVAAMLRRGTNWKTNVSQGGEGRAVSARRAGRRAQPSAPPAPSAPTTPASTCCRDDGDYSVIEVNTIPGWRRWSASTGVEAAQSSSTTCSEVRRAASER
jgi:tetrahydromethanopterin:alpha-L-glutamate ligase